MQPCFILVFSHAIYTGEFFIPREKLLFVSTLYGIRSNIIHHIHLYPLRKFAIHYSITALAI